MDVSIKGSPLRGGVQAPPSKSYAQRGIICAMLSAAETFIEIDRISDDIQLALDAVISLGGGAAKKDGGYEISPMKRRARAAVNCGESGAMLRFLLPVCGALGIETVFSGNAGLSSRPILPLLDALRNGGCDIGGDSLPLTISGKLDSGVYRISGEVSSQFVSGLMFALPLLCGDSVIELDGQLVSSRYAEMTAEVLGDFGIAVAKTNGGYAISGSQHYVSPKRFVPEGDWSGAAPLLLAGMLSGGVSVRGLSQNSVQPDKAVTDCMRAFGADVRFDGGTCTVAELIRPRAIEFDVSGSPDLFPALFAASAFADGTSRFYGAERLKYKESDRLNGMIEIVNALGGEAYFSNGCACVRGKERIDGGSFSCHNDHRLAMAGAILAARSRSPVTVMGAECASKSYPDFFDNFRSVGGDIDVL